jgi:hypothetical protein
MLPSRPQVEEFVRDRLEALRRSAQTVKQTQALCTSLSDELVKLRLTIENGHECVKTGQHKLRKAKILYEW